MIRVVDTNVLVLADEGSAHTDPVCGLACVRYLAETIKGARIGVDAWGMILREYHHRVRPNLQPGVGHEFLIHLYRHHHNSEHVERVPITPHQDREFEEFPDDPELITFDRADRKFVAVALGCSQTHEIANATDSDWAQHQTALERNGITVRQLCQGLV